MRLLILTQKVDENDGVLGFFLRWISEFSKQCESVTVIALYVGEHSLPENVKVLSLGKESKVSKVQYLTRFFAYIWKYRHEYDSVFVHMNQIYVVLGGFLWKLLGKRISLWYTHKEVSLLLRIATIFADAVYTASPESFRIASPKVHVVGHGIDTQYLAPQHLPSETLRLMTIGRISPVKGYETMIEATETLRKKGIPIALDIIGAPGTKEQETYSSDLQKLIEEKGLADIVAMSGAVPHAKVREKLMHADIFLNLSETGSLDKAVLEAMAMEVVPLTSNEGLKSTLREHAPLLMVPKGNADELVLRIELVRDMEESDVRELGEKLRARVVSEHSIGSLISKILAILGGHGKAG